MEKTLRIKGIPFSERDIENVCKIECDLCDEEYRTYYIDNKHRVIEVSTERDIIILSFKIFCHDFIQANLRFSEDFILYSTNEKQIFYNDVFDIVEKLNLGRLLDLDIRKDSVIFVCELGTKKVRKSDLVYFFN